MRIDDYVCLGRTVPEESKKYGYKVCSAGYSAELGSLVRVYPLPVRCAIRQRAICRAELLRNPLDSRVESWKLRRECDNCVEVVGEQPKASLRPIFDKLAARSIRELNEQRKSLAILRPQAVAYEARRREDVRDPCQRTLFDDYDQAFGANAVHIAPYLRFWDAHGEHCLQLREWGCYEFIRKNPGDAHKLKKALRLDDGDVYLFVGNMSNCRNIWLVISAWSFPRENQKALQLDEADA